ncbi:MAG: hypothetical protein O6952_03305, partial [Planctomycetota bacterium]|nr:hypothetical protein [Planctomycetota bacterium]
RWAARRRMAYLQASVGKHQLALGEIEAGRQTLGRAVRTWPFSLKTWRLIPKSYFPRPRRSRTDGDGHSSNDRSPLELTVRTGESERVRRIVDRYQKSLERGGIRILREGHKGRVARLPDPDGEVIVKHYRSGGLADSLRSLISGSRAVRAWNHADALRRKGLGAPPIVGVADRDWRGMPFDSLLIMAPIADAVEMDRALCRVAEGPARHEELRSMLSLFARTLRDMHEAGLVHADLKSCNVLVHGARSAWGFTFLDLEDLSLRAQVPLKLRLENLAQLNATVPSWIGTSDRLRFFLSVLGKSRLDTEGKDLFRGVLERSRQKDRVWYDKEGVVRESWSPV